MCPPPTGKRGPTTIKRSVEAFFGAERKESIAGMGQVSRDESRSGSKAIVPLGAASSKKEEAGCTKLELYEISLRETASRSHDDGPWPVVSVALAFRRRR